ncbi:MAG: hypothetical protein K9L32_00580 [Chromatiaceae bacterium]|nr:hypothetical protein [Chromatiaceae bacterium]MCF8002700.1 hypothetical protein [Chromatiaceae bacterium]
MHITCSIAKDNQQSLAADIQLYFQDRGEPDFRELPSLQHGRIETRSIWTSKAPNTYLDFLQVGQIFFIARTTTDEKTTKTLLSILTTH